MQIIERKFKNMLKEIPVSQRIQFCIKKKKINKPNITQLIK